MKNPTKVGCWLIVGREPPLVEEWLPVALPGSGGQQRLAFSDKTLAELYIKHTHVRGSMERKAIYVCEQTDLSPTTTRMLDEFRAELGVFEQCYALASNVPKGMTAGDQLAKIHSLLSGVNFRKPEGADA